MPFDLSTLSADSSLFSGEKFYVMTDSKKYQKVRKSELEIMIKKNSGSLTNSAENNNDSQRRLNLIADRETVNVSGVCLSVIWIYFDQFIFSIVLGMRNSYLLAEIFVACDPGD